MLRGGGRAFPHREMFGIIGVRDRASGCSSLGSGITRIIVRDRGHLPLGVQLELGATTSLFEDRGLRDRESGTIVRVRGAGSGAHRGISPDLPRQHLLLPGGIPCPGAAGAISRTIVRYRTGGPAVPALIKKFILGVDILYNMGYYGSIV